MSTFDFSSRKNITQYLLKYENYFIFFILLFFACLGWNERFIMDDAYISFRYSQNFAEGLGLRWNPHEIPVEGYTNFLWVILISVGFYFNQDPILFSQILGLIFYLLALLYTYLLAKLIFDSILEAFVVLFLSGLNYSFASFATGGLETMLQTFLTIYCLYETLKLQIDQNPSINRRIFLSIAFAAALLTRLDAGIVVAVCSISLLLDNKASTFKEKIRKLTALFLPMFLIVTLWLAWKYIYYGQLLPASYYAKVDRITLYSLLRGSAYLGVFLLIYGIIFFIPLLIKRANYLIHQKEKQILTIYIFVIIWLMYLIRLGGDVFDFRFLIPIIPMIYLLLIESLKNYSKRILFYSAAFLGACSLACFIFPNVYVSVAKHVTTPIKNLKKFEDQWSSIGKKMHEYFHNDQNLPVIAVTAAGAIPFYSQLQTVDMIGLNTPLVLEKGYKRKLCLVCQAHQKIAKIENLIELKTDLIIGHPLMIQNEEIPLPSQMKSLFYDENIDWEILPPSTKILIIPIDKKYSLAVLYISKNPYVEKMISQEGWKVYSFD